MNYLNTLAEATAPHMPWYHGIHIPLEGTELLITLTLFFGVLISVYYIQRWIGDY